MPTISGIIREYDLNLIDIRYLQNMEQQLRDCKLEITMRDAHIDSLKAELAQSKGE